MYPGRGQGYKKGYIWRKGRLGVISAELNYQDTLKMI
jgi:hypothetical protein